MKIVLRALAVTGLCLVAGCSKAASNQATGTSAVPPPTGVVYATWTLSGTANTSACTQTLPDATTSFCSAWTFTLQESAGFFVGHATANCYPDLLDVTGTMIGTVFTGTAAFPSGNVISFHASVSGTSVTLSPTLFAGPGTEGSCSVSGTYTGTQTTG